jgi:hypothetical protein
MKSYIFLLISLVVLPAITVAQQVEEDPFENDPLFNKPLDTIFGDYNVENTKHDGFGYLHSSGLDYDDILEAGPYNSNSLYGQYPSLPMIHYNRVDALFLGVEKERMQWYDDAEFLGIPDFRPHGLIGYSFGLKELQYTAGVEKFIGKKNHIMVGTEYHSATSTDDYWRVGLNETSLTAFSSGYDYLDYYKQRGWGTYILFRTDRFFEGGLSYNDNEFSSLQTQSDWALLGTSGRLRPNPPVDMVNGISVENIDVSSLSINASFNPKRLLLSRNFTFAANGTVEFGDPGIGVSDYSYTKYRAEISSFINFDEGSVFKYRFRAGSITGDAPAIKEFQLGGLGSLRALPYKSLPTGRLGDNQMLLSNAEVHFGAPDFGADGWIDNDDFFISLFLDSGWTNFSSDLTESTNPFTGFSDFSFADLEHNGGFGFGSSLIRGELAWDLRNASQAPVFWLRFNPTF